MTQGKAQTARFPGRFVSGQDAVSQAQMMDYAQITGWSLRPGEPGCMIASREGRDDVVLPPSGIKYSVDESARLMAGLNPSPYTAPARGRPGSPELAEVLQFYRVSGLPTVGVGRQWGPFVPQIHEPTNDAPALKVIDDDMWAVARQRWEWAQPWYPSSVTAENRDEVLRRKALWRAETKQGKPATKWRPCSHVAICMWASSARHLSGTSDGAIGELIQAKDPRTAHRAVRIGSRTWASLGAWPWASREEGALEQDWSNADDIWQALHEHVERIARRSRRLATLIST